jgi:AraC-like DNA-binding protein
MLANPEYLRENPVVLSDPLSEILAFVDARSVMSGALVAGGAWALRFRRPNVVKFFGVARGACWLAIDGEMAPTRLEAGDVILLGGQRSFVLAGDLTADTADAAGVLLKAGDGIARYGNGEEFFMLAGHVTLDAARGALLLDVLPPCIHVGATAAEATVLRWLLDQLVREAPGGRPGASHASAQLAQLMFVQVLRVHLAAAEPGPVGWLRALSDERLAPALRLMHGDPGRAWQLRELAEAAAMSRTSFALHFKTVAGVAPLTYLLGWRMRLAERALREGNTPVADLAQSLGYTSESAFSNAFKRTMGAAPKRYQAASRTLRSVAEPPRERLNAV